MDLALIVGSLGFAVSAVVAFLARRLGSRGVALAWLGVLAFVTLVFGALSAGYSDGAVSAWHWDEAARYVWLPGALAILAGGAAGWALGARRGGPA
jgi:hypothetical protein